MYLSIFMQKVNKFDYFYYEFLGLNIRVNFLFLLCLFLFGVSNPEDAVVQLLLMIFPNDS